MKRAILLTLVLTLIVVPAAAAQKSDSIKLLTVAEKGEDKMGGTADLHLTVKPGNGRIFIDSFPLTKLDTQISTRFANEIVCKHLDLDCNDYDFFYTIKADSSIVGGPSAGAGIAVLTAAVMKDLPLNDSVSITGTINSGGIIGPVAGAYEKILAAQDVGIKKVVIPKWVSFNSTEFSNKTGSNLSIEVVQAGNLDEAIYEFTGREFNGKDGEINISRRYLNRMNAVADIICDRTKRMEEKAERIDANVSEDNFTQRKESAYNNSNYYTAASYCFSRNLDLRRELVANMTIEEKTEKVQNLTEDIGKADERVDKKRLKTLSDLEAYMIVKERLSEATQALQELDLEEIPDNELAYITERYFSAVAWSQFFGLGGKPYKVNPEHLRTACQKKIQEAEERLDYVSTLSPQALEETRKELDLAYQDKQTREYALCVFKASKAKAEANTFLLGITVKREDLPRIIGEKLDATKRVILSQQEKGIFPILGYSYYEYADALKKTNPSSALMFSDYSLVMSNLDLYFPQEEDEEFELPNVNWDFVLLFLSGAILGFALGFVARSENSG